MEIVCPYCKNEFVVYKWKTGGEILCIFCSKAFVPSNHRYIKSILE